MQQEKKEDTNIALKPSISKKKEFKTFFFCAVITFLIINETILEKKVNIKAVQCGKEDIARERFRAPIPC